MMPLLHDFVLYLPKLWVESKKKDVFSKGDNRLPLRYNDAAASVDMMHDAEITDSEMVHRSLSVPLSVSKRGQALWSNVSTCQVVK